MGQALVSAIKTGKYFIGMKVSDSYKPIIATGQRMVYWYENHMSEVCYEGQLQVQLQDGI